MYVNDPPASEKFAEPFSSTTPEETSQSVFRSRLTSPKLLTNDPTRDPCSVTASTSAWISPPMQLALICRSHALKTLVRLVSTSFGTRQTNLRVVSLGDRYRWFDWAFV